MSSPPSLPLLLLFAGRMLRQYGWGRKEEEKRGRLKVVAFFRFPYNSFFPPFLVVYKDGGKLKEECGRDVACSRELIFTTNGVSLVNVATFISRKFA